MGTVITIDGRPDVPVALARHLPGVGGAPAAGDDDGVSSNAVDSCNPAGRQFASGPR